MKTCRTAVKRRKPVLKIANLKSLITAAWKVIKEKTRPRIVATQLKIHQQLRQKFMIRADTATVHMDMIP